MSGSWELRPAGPEDLEAVAEVYRAEDLRYRGRSEVSAESIGERHAADPDFDPVADQVIAVRQGQVAASAILRGQGAMLAVHPDHDVPGLRASVISWTEWRQRQLGRTPFRVSVPGAFTASVELLLRAGYELERFYAQMVRDLSAGVGWKRPRLPAAYRSRPIDRHADVPELHALHERAFAGRPDHHPESLMAYAAHLSSRRFAPSWSRVLEAPGGEFAGSLIAQRRTGDPGGYVEILAVDPAHRRRGLARTLLLETFARMAADGRPSAGLHVASDNPRALDLYRGVGTTETERIEEYVRRPG